MTINSGQVILHSLGAYPTAYCFRLRQKRYPILVHTSNWQCPELYVL